MFPWNRRDFTRAGEFGLERGVYMWQPVTVPAGSYYVMYYGLGGVTVVPGQLQLGRSPAEFYGTSERSFSIVAYIQNTGQVQR